MTNYAHTIALCQENQAVFFASFCLYLDALKEVSTHGIGEPS